MTTLTAPHPPDPLCWGLGVQGKQTYIFIFIQFIHYTFYGKFTLLTKQINALHFSLYYNKLYHAIFIPTNIKAHTFVSR